MVDFAKKELSKKTREKYISEISQWEESLNFISEEIRFLEKLLGAGIFEPNIPNLYEMLQQYSKKLQALIQQEILLEKGIAKHKTDLARGIEENGEHTGSSTKNNHLQLRKNIKTFSKKFSGLKLMIFIYTGNIFKKST